MRFLKTAVLLGSALALASCGAERQKSARDVQAEEGARRAEAAVANRAGANSEQDNIERRLKLTSQPGVIGYVLLLNQMGQPIVYTTVKGKITSSGKRLTAPVKWWGNTTACCDLGAAPSDEGTWGSSDNYVYFWNAEGQYYQWNGTYLYSDKPIRPSTPALVVDVK